MTQTIKALSAIAAVALLTTGCATKTWYNEPATCALAGAAIGGGAGMADKEDTAIVGALGGAVIGATICALMQPTDVDGDGVTDDKDQCPKTAAGAKVDALGCEIDSDGDGVGNSVDECQMTPEGVKVDSKGCALDTDGDGVADYKDHCPNSPEGAEINKLGCENDLVLENVNFEFDSAEMTEAGKAALEDDIARLKYVDDGDLITIEGYTDSTGSAEYNKALSQRRAESVLNHVISEGIGAKSMKAVGYGEERPIADNSTEEGRQQNRRVSFHAE